MTIAGIMPCNTPNHNTPITVNMTKNASNRLTFRRKRKLFISIRLIAVEIKIVLRIAEGRRLRGWDKNVIISAILTADVIPTRVVFPPELILTAVRESAPVMVKL